jgi:micrococcal nuclease
MYHYKVHVYRVVDGDTFDAQVDLGFGIYYKMRFRMRGIDTPETWRPSCDAEREHGLKATEFVDELIGGKEVTIQSYKMGIYGRYECDVILGKQTLAQILKDEGFEKKESYE